MSAPQAQDDDAVAPLPLGMLNEAPAIDPINETDTSERKGQTAATRVNSDSAVLKLKGLPYQTSERTIYEFFGDEYNIRRVAFVFEPDGRPSGLAFAEFESKEEAIKALSKNGEYIGERYVRLLHVPMSEMEEQVRLGTLAVPGNAAKLRSRLLRAQQRPNLAYLTGAPLQLMPGGVNTLMPGPSAASQIMSNPYIGGMSGGPITIDARSWAPSMQAYQQSPAALAAQFSNLTLASSGSGMGGPQMTPQMAPQMQPPQRQQQLQPQAQHQMALSAPGHQGGHPMRGGGPPQHQQLMLAQQQQQQQQQQQLHHHIATQMAAQQQQQRQLQQRQHQQQLPAMMSNMHAAAASMQAPPAPPPVIARGVMVGGGAPPSSATIKVRGLPYRASPTEILAFFQGYQYLPDSLQIGLDSLGRPSGEAWLTFVNSSETLRCVRDLNRHYLGNRYLELSIC